MQNIKITIYLVNGNIMSATTDEFENIETVKDIIMTSMKNQTPIMINDKIFNFRHVTYCNVEIVQS
jgi:hypothetical protein